jgi:hypothetical protein
MSSRPSLHVQQAKPLCPAGQTCMSSRPNLYVQQAKPVCPAGLPVKVYMFIDM